MGPRSSRRPSRHRSSKMDLYYRAVEQAAATWQTVKQLPNYEAVVGELLFREIFEMAPVALSLYSFGEQQQQEADCHTSVPDSVFQSPAFISHARGVVSMLENVIVMMLGNDMDTLATSLQALGSRHVDYGVHPAHYRVVETALLRTLAGALGGEWTDEVRKGWMAVFKFISKAMMAGAGAELQIIKDKRRKLERNKSATLRLRVIGNSRGISRLSRSGVSTSTTITKSGRTATAAAAAAAVSPPSLRYCSSDSDVRYTCCGSKQQYSCSSKKHQQQSRSCSRSATPPTKPTRLQTLLDDDDDENDRFETKSSMLVPIRKMLDRRWSDLAPPLPPSSSSFLEDDMMTTSDDDLTRSVLSRAFSFSSADDSSVDTVPLPNIIVIETSNKKAPQAMDVNTEQQHLEEQKQPADVAPKKPKRIIEEEEEEDCFLVCKRVPVPKEEEPLQQFLLNDGTDMTVESSTSYDDDHDLSVAALATTRTSKSKDLDIHEDYWQETDERIKVDYWQEDERIKVVYGDPSSPRSSHHYHPHHRRHHHPPGDVVDVDEYWREERVKVIYEV